MLQIVICDDDASELEQTRILLAHYLERWPGQDLSLHYFQSPLRLLDFIDARQDGFDIYLLDILMPGMDGIELGRKIRAKDERAAIVYLTSSPDFAVQSYSVQAFYYLIKPFGQDELFPVLDRLLEQLRRETGTLLPVRTRAGIVPVRLEQLLYAEMRSHVASYHLAGGKSVESLTLRSSFDQAMSPLLSDKRFLKINASYVVNMGFIAALSGNCFRMADGVELSITRRCAADIKQAYLEFLIQRGRSL